MKDPTTSAERRPFEIADILRKSNSAEFALIREMVGLMIEISRRRMVDANDATEMYRLQGEARAFDRLYRRLTQGPPGPQE